MLCLAGAFTLLSNYTTQAITVGQAQALCQNGEPKVPIVEATISSLHMVCPVDFACALPPERADPDI